MMRTVKIMWLRYYFLDLFIHTYYKGRYTVLKVKSPMYVVK